MTRSLRGLYLALLALGLLVTGISAALRAQADAASRTVMVLVDWRELNALAEPEGQAAATLTDRRTHTLAWELLKAIPGAYLAYGEETVGDLDAQGVIRPSSVVTTGPAFEVLDPRYARDIAAGAERHGYWFQRNADTYGRLVVQFPSLGLEGVSSQPLAWREDVIAAAKSHNIPVILRPGGSDFFGPDGIGQSLGYAANQPLVLFQGNQVLGYPHSYKDVAAQLKRQNQLYGWVEFDDQDGGGELARLMAPQVARVHSITSEELEKYTIERAVARFELAVTERGIRTVFLRPFPKVGLNQLEGRELGKMGYRDAVREVNLAYFTAVKDMLERKGYTIGVPKPFTGPPAWLGPMRRIAVTLATVAGTLLLLGLAVPTMTRRWELGLLVVGCVLALGAAVVGKLYTLVLLATGIVFPLLGFWVALLLYQRRAHALPAWDVRRLLWALLALLAASACSIAGGILIHGGMWDARALLHIDQYRGVTLTLAIPVLIVAAYCWHAETLQDAWDGAGRRLLGYWQRFLALWTAPIRYGDVAFILLAVGAVGIVLLRSGNEGPVGASGLETMLRGWLEGTLDVRPRTKEIFGHPALVLLLLTLPWRTRFSLLLALGAIVGQTSILNTFCHLHTPLTISLQRVALGLILGVVSGLVWGAVVLAGARVWANLRGRTATS